MVYVRYLPAQFFFVCFPITIIYGDVLLFISFLVTQAFCKNFFYGLIMVSMVMFLSIWYVCLNLNYQLSAHSCKISPVENRDDIVLPIEKYQQDKRDSFVPCCFTPTEKNQLKLALPICIHGQLVQMHLVFSPTLAYCQLFLSAKELAWIVALLTLIIQCVAVPIG